MPPSEIPQPLILIVDDEVRILSALKRLLRREPYRLATVSSGEEALALLDQQKVDLVLSDFRMPECNGLELMAMIQAQHPETCRILMSGNADFQLVIHGINEGLIEQFVEKPWADEALKISLSKLIAAHQLQIKNKELLATVQAQNLLLSQESEKVQREIRQKERLFATISHEIRNPLAAMSGCLELLAQDPAMGERGENARMIQIIQRESNRLSSLVKDFLNYARPKPPHLDLVRLGELVEH